MNIGIDIDDTISETFETVLPYAQKYTIEDLKRKSEINMNQDFLDHFYIVKMNGWNEQEAICFWNKYFILPYLFANPAGIFYSFGKFGSYTHRQLVFDMTY